MQVFYQGNLGNQVKELQELDESITFTPILNKGIINDYYDPTKEIYVMITDNPLIDYGKSLEKIVMKDRKIFLPIIINFPYLTIGPLSIEGSKGCFHCFIDRLLQHDPTRELLQETYQYYDVIENRGNVGIHPADAITVSNMINSLKVSSDDVIANWRGKVSRLNLFDRSLVSSQVIGLSFCKICSEKQEPKEVSYKNMKKHLEEGVFQL